MSVFVRWYKEVVEGTIVKENDMFGMTVVEIPIQGVKVLSLFNPKHIYQTPKEAVNIEFDGKSLKNDSFELKIDGIQPVPPIMEYPTDVHGDFLDLQKFRAEHWNHERNMLQLDYWQEYDRMFFDYMRRKLQKDKPQQMEPMKIEHPETPEEAKWQEPAPANQVEVKPIPAAKLGDTKVTPLSIGKKVTVTELSLF